MTGDGVPASCLDENDAIRVVLEPDDARVDSLRAHVDECESCRELVAAVARFVVSGAEHSGPRWLEPELPAGAEIGAYRIVEPIGRGAMGRVYLAEDVRLERQVALKLLDPGLHDAVAQRRIVAEARSMARLQDPHVVEVFDVGTSPHGPYVAMAYIDGADLAAWIEAEARRPEEITECLVQAGRGLAAAHAAGLVHRDFKPANVLVGRDGVVRVADFGLARLRGPAESSAQEGASGRSDLVASRSGTAIAGTPAYMAPEQLRGRSVGPAADQFAYCVTLYEALAGHRPFPEDTPADRLAAIEACRVLTPARPIPRAILTVLRRGLRPDPRQRFASMTVLLEGLRRRTPRPWVFLVGIVLLGLGAASFVLGERGAVPCSLDRPPLRWPDVVRAPLEQAWSRLGASTYDVARLLRRLDDRAGAWGDAYRRVCLDASTSPAPAVLGTLRCLEAQGREFEAFTGAAQTATLARVEGYVSAAAQLSPPSECTRASTSWAEHPGLAADASRLSNAVLRAQARGDPERRIELRAEILEVIGRAEQARADVPHARLCHLVGVLDSEAGEHEAAGQWFERAYFLAKDAAALSLAFDAALAKGTVAGSHLHDVDDAWRWLRHARATLGERDDPEQQMRLLLREADLQMLTDHDAALASLRRAEALLDGSAPESSAALYGSLGQLLAQRGDDAGCRDAYAKAIGDIERERGPEHRDLIRPLLGLATCEHAPQFHQQGLAHLERAVDLSEQHGYAAGEAMARGNLGLLFGMLGRPTRSYEQLLRSDALMREVYPPEHVLVARSGYQLAKAQLAVGRFDEAVATATAARALFERQSLDTGTFIFDCELVRARAELALGRSGMVERFEDLRARASFDQDRADATLGLGQAMLTDGRREEAITLLSALYADDPAHAELSALRQAEGRLWLARALFEEERQAEGRRQLELALSVARPYEGDDPQGVVAQIRGGLESSARPSRPAEAAGE